MEIIILKDHIGKVIYWCGPFSIHEISYICIFQCMKGGVTMGHIDDAYIDVKFYFKGKHFKIEYRLKKNI